MGNSIKKIRSSNEFKQHYDLKEILGTGSFAVVKRAVLKSTGQEFAVKIIKKSKLSTDDLAAVHDEVEIMHKIDHPHCVKLVEMYESKAKIYMVLELLTGGELFDRIVSKGSYSEREASTVIRSVASALTYLHSVGICHRDLKPENLLYADPSFASSIKLTDFGLAKYRSHSELNVGMKTACGTPGYVSPEIVMNTRYTFKTDVWSLGVIAYILLCGFPPFYSESTHELYQQIKHGDYSFPSPYWTDISNDAKDLIRNMLNVDPNKRFSAAQVLAHPWCADTGAAPTKALSAQHTRNLMVMQARRRLRRCVQIVRVITRLSNLAAARDDQPASRTQPFAVSSSNSGHASSSSLIDSSLTNNNSSEHLVTLAGNCDYECSDRDAASLPVITEGQLPVLKQGKFQTHEASLNNAPLSPSSISEIEFSDDDVLPNSHAVPEHHLPPKIVVSL